MAEKSEIQEYLDIRQQRRWIFPQMALVGLGAETVTLGFRAALTIALAGTRLFSCNQLACLFHVSRWSPFSC